MEIHILALVHGLDRFLKPLKNDLLAPVKVIYELVIKVIRFVKE